jgi:predicted phosphoadenosine phosphosulfate sulfurtransferase
VGRLPTGLDVYQESLDRLCRVYDEGHRVVVSFSGGKDSGVCVELCIAAAEMTGRLPVEVLMRDEEIMFPGTFEYAERIAERSEVSFHWIIAGQPVLNVFNRERPYWWVFDPDEEDKWVRPPPARAYWIEQKDILRMIIPERFPPAEGKSLVDVVGLRVAESRARAMGLHSSGSYMTKPNSFGVRKCRPIYDWGDGDVWRAHQLGGWDYNAAYDTMLKMGVARKHMRIGPPTMNMYGIQQLRMARSAWPQWFDLVARRCPGMRTAADFGTRSAMPLKRHGESWQETFDRECIRDAPQWIAERAANERDRRLRRHTRHSRAPFPEVKTCMECGVTGSWKALAMILYGGDPFSMKATNLPYVEPNFFREGAGTWGGAPSFS